MIFDWPCIECKQRHPHCHGTCEAYRKCQRSALTHKYMIEQKKRKEGLHSSYVREKHNNRLPQNIDNSPLRLTK